VAENSLTPNCEVKYKSSGDVSTNSPGDYDRIKANADAFKDATGTKPSRWGGWSDQQEAANGCMTNNDNVGPELERGKYLRDAALVYLLTGDTDYRDAVRTELVAQAAVAGVD
jgi:hypothetical protein